MERLTTKMSIMDRKHDLVYGLASIWKKKLKKYKYELIEDAVDKLGKLEDLEEEMGCPLEVRCKVVEGTEIYDMSGKEFVVEFISYTHFGAIDASLQRTAFGWNNYKRYWWLKADRSE